MVFGNRGRREEGETGCGLRSAPLRPVPWTDGPDLVPIASSLQNRQRALMLVSLV